MNATKQKSRRTGDVRIESRETRRVHFASDKAVQKAHKRAIEKFAGMFRKLAQ
jgi:hypothetical protein